MSWQIGNFGEEQEYVVQSGDSLSKISMKFYGSYDYVQAIANANGIKDVNKISVGQVLTIPERSPVQSGPVKPGPPYQSPILVPLPQPTPPGYDIPYTQPITLPAPPKEIPYTQPITLPAPPPTTPAPPATYKQPTNVSIMSLLSKVQTTASKKVLGLSVAQWAGVTALAGLTVAMLASMGTPKTAKNPRRRRR